MEKILNKVRSVLPAGAKVSVDPAGAPHGFSGTNTLRLVYAMRDANPKFIALVSHVAKIDWTGSQRPANAGIDARASVAEDAAAAAAALTAEKAKAAERRAKERAKRQSERQGDDDDDEAAPDDAELEREAKQRLAGRTHNKATAWGMCINQKGTVFFLDQHGLFQKHLMLLARDIDVIDVDPAGVMLIDAVGPSGGRCTIAFRLYHDPSVQDRSLATERLAETAASTLPHATVNIAAPLYDDEEEEEEEEEEAEEGEEEGDEEEVEEEEHADRDLEAEAIPEALPPPEDDGEEARRLEEQREEEEHAQQAALEAALQRLAAARKHHMAVMHGALPQTIAALQQQQQAQRGRTPYVPDEERALRLALLVNKVCTHQRAINSRQKLRQSIYAPVH